jgi:hypothetical protein
MAGKNQHVVPHEDGGWAVKGAGNERATRRFDTKEEAEKFGRETAKRQKSELIVHGKDGSIQSRNSYGGDPAQKKN